MCVLATGSRIDPVLIIVRVTYWRLPSVINLGHLEDSIGGRLLLNLLNLLHLFILVTVQIKGGESKKGEWRGGLMFQMDVELRYIFGEGQKTEFLPID